MISLQQVFRVPEALFSGSVLDAKKRRLKPLTLDVVFSVTRGRPAEALGGFLPDSDRTRITSPSINVLRFPFRPPADGGPFSLTMKAMGEPVELVKYILRDDQGTPQQVLAPTPCGKGYTPYGPDHPDWEAISESIDTAGYVDSLDAELAKSTMASDRLRDCRFFAAFDRQTNAVLIDELARRGLLHRDDAAQRKLGIESVTNELRERVRLRACRFDPDHPAAPDLTDRVYPHLLARCQKISTLFLEIIGQHFTTPAEFEVAFERFSNGALRFKLPSLVMTTQPSSGYFFLFGEFALMCIDYDVDRIRWEELANVMVRAQLIFSQVYAPPDKAGASFLSYLGSNFECFGDAYEEPEIQKLRTDYASVNLSLEAARNASENMPGLIS